MKIQIDTGIDKAVNLDEIVDLIFSHAADDEKPSGFDFVGVNDDAIMDAIAEYTQSVKEYDFTDISCESWEDTVGSLSENLTDAIFKANLDYFKQGIKFGARLLMELTA